MRLDIRRIGAVKRGDEVIGSETRVKVVKNKVAPPFRQAEFEILYGEGTSREGELIELGVLHGMVDKAGAWYSYNGDRIGQGKDNVRMYLKENPAIANDIDTRLREKLLVKSGTSPLPAVEVEEGSRQKGTCRATQRVRQGHRPVVTSRAVRPRAEGQAGPQRLRQTGNRGSAGAVAALQLSER